MVDMPIESPRKYGSMNDEWEEAGDEFANALAGGNRDAGGRRRPTADASQPADDNVDEEFLRQAGRSDSHYGR